MMIFNGQILEVGNEQPPKPGAGVYRQYMTDRGYRVVQMWDEVRFTLKTKVVTDILYEKGQRLWIIDRIHEHDRLDRPDTVSRIDPL